MWLPLIGFYAYILFRECLRQALESGWELWLFDILGFVCPSLLIMEFYIRCRNVPFRQFYIFDDKRGTLSGRKFFILTVICVPLFCATAYLSGYVGYYVAVQFPQLLVTDFHTLPSYGAPFRYFVRIYIALTSGIIEELIFRGSTRIIWKNMVSVTNHYGYVFFSAILFSFLHWIHGLASMVEAMLQGIFLGALYIKINDLRPLIAGHIVWDLI